MWVRSEAKACRRNAVSLSVDGQEIKGYPGEMLAVSLQAAGIRTFRYSPESGMPRGPFCLIGVCQECLVVVNGRRALSCREVVIENMEVCTLGVKESDESCATTEQLK